MALWNMYINCQKWVFLEFFPKILTFEYYSKSKTYLGVNFICVYQILSNWLRNGRQKSKMAATKFSFFDNFNIRPRWFPAHHRDRLVYHVFFNWWVQNKYLYKNVNKEKIGFNFHFYSSSLYINKVWQDSFLHTQIPIDLYNSAHKFSLKTLTFLCMWSAIKIK